MLVLRGGHVFNSIMEIPDGNRNNDATTGEFAYEVGIRAMDSQAKAHGGMRYFINECGKGISRQKSDQLERLNTLSAFIADVYGDKSDADNQKAIKSAFLKGVVTGICVAELSYDQLIDIDDVVETIEAERRNYETITDFYIHHGRTLIETGHQANEEMMAYDGTINEWESECVTDIRYHQYYRMGLGIFMGNAAKVVYKMWSDRELELMAEELGAMNDHDWDAALRALEDDAK